MSDFDAMLDSLRRLGRLPEDAANVAAPLVEAALRATAAAGTDPQGKAWPPKKDGGRPLVNAASHITTTAVGRVVRTTLAGVEVFHHFGAGVPKRQILPDPGTIPEQVGEALERAAGQAFARAVG